MKTLLPTILVLAVNTAWAQEPQRKIVFQESFADISLPGWHGPKPAEARVSAAKGPGDIPALTMETDAPVTANLTAALPVEQVAGKAIVLEVWRKAENVKTGTRHYYNAKAMLSWKAKSDAKPKYSRTTYSDFSGTFDWEKHRYIIQMPKDLEWAAVTIGLQNCTGKASWAGLTVGIDPRFPTQQALDQYLERQERELFAHLDGERIVVKCLDGGIIQVFTGRRYVPRRFWNATVRKAVLAAVPRPDPSGTGGGNEFSNQLARALAARTVALEAGLDALASPAANDRVYEIASLRERVRQMANHAVAKTSPIHLRANPASVFPVNELVFGNNINTQNLSAPYDPERGKFQDDFLERVRPMGITFLRYPGGCNADVFNWKDTIGPLDRRNDLINYHNGMSRGKPVFGVDEFLRFCEQEGMTPIITTAFCKDLPARIDPTEHPKGVRHKFVFSYIKTAPDRIRLAADWVEYCNGSPDTRWGKLRAENGHPGPYNVKFWEIGNESYGPDPVGSCKPEEYARAFPAYVTAMKARDPSIKIIMNGGSPEWNDVVLRLAGKIADAFQFHIYRTPRVSNYTKTEGRPWEVSAGMRLGDNIPGLLDDLESTMKKHVGHTLPVIISEFGMGNARNRELMTSVTSAVLVADMWRDLIESPLVLGANKWCLYTGYWFSQIQGPTLRNPTAPYYNRPEWIMHVIYARCRGPQRLAVNNNVSPGVKAVVFRRADSYGIVLISRNATNWQQVIVDLPGVRPGKATCLLLTAGHPFLGNEYDNDLVRQYKFTFDYTPGTPIALPPNSVMGLIVSGG